MYDLFEILYLKIDETENYETEFKIKQFTMPNQSSI